MMNTLQKFKGHLMTVLTHKYYVFKFCCKAGMPMRGLLHDLSKFSPTEFFESVKYYQGTRSPIDACKEDNGWSAAWMHHKGRNRSHYEFWQDDFDHGGHPLQMPFEDALEMMCDYLGAGKAYMRNDFSYTAELEWWRNKKASGIAMHPQTMKFVDLMFEQMAKDEDDEVLKMEHALVKYRVAKWIVEKKSPVKARIRENLKNSKRYSDSKEK